MIRRGLVGALAVAVAAATAALGAVPSASAAGNELATQGHHIGKVVYPTRSAHAAQQASTATATIRQLTYGGGVDNIGVTTGYPKVYLVFWGSQWGTTSTDANGYTTLSNDPSAVAVRLQQLFKGLGTNNEAWSGVMTQYCEGIPAGSTSCPSTSPHEVYPYGGALAGLWVDNSTAVPMPPAASATEHQLAAEAVSAAAHFGNLTSASNRAAQYFVVSPHGAQPDGFNTSSSNWCAWHDWNGDTTLTGGAATSTVGDVAFTNLPYLPDAGQSCGQNFVNSGSGGDLDGVTMVAGHEYAETITDQNPLGGWSDSQGSENADKCAWISSGTGAAGNVAFSTGSFAMQSTWANDTRTCAMSHSIVDATPGVPVVGTANPGNGEATVAFAPAAANGGSPVKYFTATATDTNNASQAPVSVQGTTSPITVTGLTNGDSYTLTVTATNGKGTSAASAASNPVTPGGSAPGAPDAPTALSATAGNAQVVLSWNAPTTGASGVTGYNVYRGTASGSYDAEPVTTTASTSFTDTGVSNGTTYYYAVTAVNGAGESADSLERSAHPATVPDPPAIGAATGLAGAATIDFTGPAWDGGSPITSYTVTATDQTLASRGHQSASGTSHPITVSGLTNGDTYTFTVIATNAMGPSLASAASNAVVPSTTPSAPQQLTAAPGNGLVTLSWQPPSTTGGSTISGYTITRTPAFQSGTITVTATTYADSAVSNGSAYTYAVKAVNANGSSPPASASATPATVPGAPTGVTGTPSNASVSVSFTAPPDGGSAITGYTVASTDTTAAAPGPSVNGVASPVNVAGLTNGHSYTFVVTAHNAVGAGPPSTATPAITPRTVPSAPTGVSATASDARVTLTWSPPSSDGGATIAGYEVYRSTSAAAQGSVVTSTTATSYVDSSVTDGTTYYYEIVADNVAGAGAPSTQLAARPHAAPTVTFTSSPPALSNLSTATFDFDVNDNGNVSTATRCSLDGAASAPCSSGVAYGALSDGAHSLVVTASDSDGLGGTSSYAWTVDTHAPVVTMTSPALLFTLSTPRAAWRATDATSGVASYDVRYRTASPSSSFGAWSAPADWQQTTSTTVSRAVTPGVTECFAVRARDHAGNVSGWSTPTCTTVPLDDRALTTSSGWHRVTNRGDYRATATTTRTKGATLTLSHVTADRLAIVATECASCGSVQVVFGGHVVTVRLHSSVTRHKVVIVLAKIAQRARTVTIRVTSSRGIIEIDGLATTRA